MLKKTLITILLLAFIVVVYFAYTVFSKRESDLIETNTSSDTQKDQSSVSESTSPSDTPQENIINNLLDPDSSADTQTENTDQKSENDTTNDYYIHVTPTDCARECEPYKYDDKELKYCQNVCGISESTSANDCDKLKDLEKDYCYKNQAIEKKDASICENISDSAIKKSCKNRIQEDVLENM